MLVKKYREDSCTSDMLIWEIEGVGERAIWEVNDGDGES